MFKPSATIGLIFYLCVIGNGSTFAESADMSRGYHVATISVRCRKVRSLPDHSIVLVSTNDGRVQRRTSQGDEVSWDINLKHGIADITISKDGQSIDFAGTVDEKDVSGLAIISQVNVRTGTVSQAKVDIGQGLPILTFDTNQPTLTFGANGELYLGGSLSSIIKRVDPTAFDGPSQSSLSSKNPSDLDNPELRGISDLTTTQSGSVLFVSSLVPRGISAFDLNVGKWIDYLPISNSKLSRGGSYQLRLSASDSTAEKAAYQNAKASIVVGDFGPTSRLIVAELDEAFGAFAIIQTVNLNFAAPGPSGASTPDQQKSPLLLSSDRAQNTIAVGSRFSRDISIYSKGGRAIELRGSRTLAATPVDISVSPDGSAVATLLSGGNQVEISYPDSAAYSTMQSSTERSQILDAQRALSELGYPVGSVDGTPGPQTTQAVALFQRWAGLHVTGVLDPATRNAITPPLPTCTDGDHTDRAGGALSAIVFYKDSRAQDSTVLKRALT